MDMVDSFRAISLIGVTAGVVFIAVGLFLLIGYPANHQEFNLYYGVVSVALGALFFWKGIQVFRPIKQHPKPSGASACPFCGALLKEDTAVCPKCKRPLEPTDAN